jgi:hypothetical protein
VKLTVKETLKIITGKNSQCANNVGIIVEPEVQRYVLNPTASCVEILIAGTVLRLLFHQKSLDELNKCFNIIIIIMIFINLIFLFLVYSFFKHITMDNTCNVHLLSTADIVKSSLNQRTYLNIPHVENLKKSLITTQQHLPPISVRRDGYKYTCHDGWHRLTAYKECGITQIYAFVEDISEFEAKNKSFNLNCGNGWTEADKARICLDDFRNGYDPKHIMEMKPSMGSRECIKDYIRIAGYLHSELLIHLGKGGSSANNQICISAAKFLMQYDLNIQKQIYDVSCAYGGTTKPNIERIINHYGYTPNNKCPINSLRSSLPILNSTPVTPVIQPQTPLYTNRYTVHSEEFAQHIDSINDQFRDLSNLYKCDYNYIFSQIRSRCV